MIKRELKFLILILISILLFSLSFPGYFNNVGFPFLSFLILFPIYYSIKKMNYLESIFWGFFYGVGNYLLFNYWLQKFDPVTFSVLPTIMGFYHILLFLLLKYIFNNFGKFSYIPLSLTWMLYEIFKGENLIGYTYGTIAHTMYQTHYFTGIIDITGTYVLSLLIIFPSVFLAVYISNKNINKTEFILVTTLYSLLLLCSILYTNINKIDYSKSKTVRTSLIQHNLDSWAFGTNELYKETLDILLELTSEALKEKPNLVVWSETAFVPAIEWHKEYKVSPFRLGLVNRLESYIKDNSNTNFVLGANETLNENEEDKIYYNSAYNYKNDNSIEKYRKVKLVPFTEMFPFPNAMPWLKSYIKSIGGKDIQPGDGIMNFTIDNLKATPLICYEDTFSNLAAEGIRLGGDLIINLTNDAWSIEEACSKQHLSAAVFRSIENRRSFIRVGTGGFTCVIDPNGKILTSLKVLTKDQTTYDVPIYNDKLTFYTMYGNVVEKFLLVLLGSLLAYCIIKSIHHFLLINRKQMIN